ncbi:MAG: hypothetical protein ACM3H9_04280 [Rhodospirillaceae bacterium]
MTKTFALLAASAALATALGVPAFSALRVGEDDESRPAIAFPDDRTRSTPLMLASNDDDDDEHGWRESWRRGGDDDDDDEEDDDCDDDDDGGCRGAAQNPAPAGTVAPPQNGLFGNGAPPQVQVN